MYACDEESDDQKDRNGRNLLNAADEVANPRGLVLSEAERNYIYGMLNSLDNQTSSLVDSRSGWQPQLRAAVRAVIELAAIVLLVGICTNPWTRFYHGLKIMLFFLAVALLILQKLNLLLTHETIDGILKRRGRQDEIETKKRAQHFKDMSSRNIDLDE